MVGFLGLYATQYICGDDKNYFNDAECRSTSRYAHIYPIAIVLGYFFCDPLFICWFKLWTEKVKRQILVHHVLALGTFLMASFTPSFLQNSGAAVLVSELTTQFIRVRRLMLQQKMKDSIWM